MRKPLAMVLTLCLGAWTVGCEAEKPVPPKVPSSDLGAPAKSGDSAKPDSVKTPAASTTTKPADKK